MGSNDAEPRLSRASIMPNPSPSGSTVAASQPIPDDNASSITVNTKAPSNFPPPKTDKPRPHVCATCQRSFARLEHLKRHERSHTKEKPFECPECSRCFARRDLLLRHQQKLHQTSTPSSRPRNRRESASGIVPGQSRARKNSVAGANPTGDNAAPASMRPRANTISHVDGAAMQMIASGNASAARGIIAHSRHPSLGGLPTHGLDHVLGGMSAALGHRGMQHGLPKLETSQMGGGEFESGLRTAPPMAVFSEFEFEGLLFGHSSTINPNALHYNDSPQAMTVDQTPFGQSMTDVTSSQPYDDGLDWFTGFEHQMSFQTSENVVDGSSPSAISTTSQSGMSDVMLDGSNHPAPAGTSTMWHSSIMGPPQMSNPFAMDLNGSVFPDLLNGAPLSPQPAPQKMNDPYFSTPPPSLSSMSPSVVSGMNTQNLSQTMGFNAGPETPSSPGGGGGNNGASPVTTISDATRIALVNALAQYPPSGGRKCSAASQDSPLSPQFQPGANAASLQTSAKLPSTQDLQRYVGAYLAYFHPHLPFLHVPTLSFDPSPTLSGRLTGVGDGGCLLLSMAAIGALYEMEHARSAELLRMAEDVISHHIQKLRRTDAQGGETRHNTLDTGRVSPADDGAARTPVRLVQAVLLYVVGACGHEETDDKAGGTGSTHCSALVGLAQAARLLQTLSPMRRDVQMADDTNSCRLKDQEEHRDWLAWKSVEERKRTLHAVFIVSSLLVAAYNKVPALTNSELSLDLPCDEEFFAAESSAAFTTRGGAEAADRNRVTFYDALGALLRTDEKQQKKEATDDSNETPSDAKPSSFGCLILINSLHNYIWETRQRHRGVWTAEETDKMHRHIEPALKAWQMAWASNPQHSVERPNPFGTGPLSADAVPLLDLAYVRLFVDLSRSKEKFWQRDWVGVTEELTRAGGVAECSQATSAKSHAIDGSERSAQDDIGCEASDQSAASRERNLRKAAFYAADSLAMSDRLGVTFVDYTRGELPLQSALCTLDCAQVLAEWISTLQDRVGRYLGVLAQNPADLGQLPAMVLLEEEDVKLLGKVREILTSAEMKLGIGLGGDSMSLSGDVGGSAVRGHDRLGLAAKLLRMTARMLGQAAVWPCVRSMSRCLEVHALDAQARAERSVAPLE
ncbi:hypothetical protein XA68_14808 [Ophiocordyceps unilateralis]|uniref:C2H2-type domain-containing protein n=1 Tax=Ophiocordyceps unilateralis TaxID=268505 RepID=A0A2A9P9T1_OPHUN|nr:hypothetical protein XA68_14808 [Ophiocordyceps unilateralis]